MHANRPLATLAALALALALAAAAAASAQSTYRLDHAGEWIEEPHVATGADADVMTETRRLIAQGRPGLAFDIINDWIERNDDRTLPETPTSYRLRGDALTALGKEFKALYDYERVARSFPQSEEFPIAAFHHRDDSERWLASRLQ